jgi:hypothetical protein
MSPTYKVIVSDAHTLEIPQAILDDLGIQPGQQYQVILYGDRLELIPILPPERAQGFLRGINTDIDDDSDDDR